MLLRTAFNRAVNHVVVESLEARRLLAVNWGASAKVIDQDDAATTYPAVTGAGVTVAILDTGVDYTHPALGGGFGPGFKVKGGWDFADNDADPLDTFGHGTNVAGIIAANQFTLNGDTYQGVAPGANIVALRVAAGGEIVTESTIEKALQWIETNYKTYGISIVNFSFGAGRYAADQTSGIASDEFKRLKDLGIFFVSPAGNDGTAGGAGINWPAADPSVVSVGSVSLADQISTFTQRGPTLDLLAPGESIGTTKRGGTYELVSLSSFSSPIVAGAAALLKQADSKLRADDILSNFRASGARKDDSTFGPRETYVRIDLDNAIALAYRRKPNAATDVGASGAANDLAYDKQGVLHFAYYDQTLHTIKHATRSTAGIWSATQIVDTSGMDVGATLSIAIDPQGRPAIAYYDATLGDLEYARFDGKSWKKSTLDSKNITGQFPSLAFDSSGNPAVAYYRKTSGDLRVMRSDGNVWTRTEPDTIGDVGQFASLDVSGTGTLGVAYADTTNGNLKYAQLSGNTWTPELVDDLATTAFISLAFDNANRPAVSYYDAYPANLKYATKATGSWQNTTITSKGAVGLFTNLWFDDGGQANIVYFNRKSDGVFRVFGSINSWSAETLIIGGGQNAVAGAKFDGSAATYSWWNPLKNKLMTNDVT